jgi:hypothetical protein
MCTNNDYFRNSNPNSYHPEQGQDSTQNNNTMISFELVMLDDG